MKNPGRFGHIPLNAICQCPNTTMDSPRIVLDPVSATIHNMWGVVWCTCCQGKGIVNLSLVQNKLEVFHFFEDSQVAKLWLAYYGL